MNLRYSIVVFLVYIFFSLPSVIKDFRFRKVDSISIYAGTVVIGVFVFLVDRSIFLHSSISALVTLSVFLITYRMMKNKLGMGDVKFSLFCGMAVGNVLWALAGLGVACIVTALTFLIGKIKGSPLKKLPFVPFLFAGTTFAMLCRIFIK